ncbi:sugar diacid recognition domain-containing protein [Weizmannia sp. CD-2023]|uniref:sugar diacid recognition domain-containing protein n=1 Tax=Heyndrickxia TaxID=2837504 RepID=UPI0005528700|nr:MULTISPECIES: sugar diacid recognition domain-containing protein [Heyndrickxia]KGT37750.1 hypothetical protein P421_13550 [Heyndrickxia coagulans P38]MED4321494.1 sugar diacid recognition domain-containing protein [Weizmannia sp. CD-2023]
MKITSVLAQKLTEQVMQILPYPVRITDEEGYVIGSVDKEQIGKLQEDAAAAIKKGTILGTKNDVHIPIQGQNKIIGAINISGDPCVIEPFADLIRMMTNLFIRQNQSDNKIKEQLRDEFIYQWIFRDAYDASFCDQAKTIGIDITTKKRAVMVKGEIMKKPPLIDQEFCVKLNAGLSLFIVPGNSTILSRLESDMIGNVKIGIGEQHVILSKSVQEARRSIEISEILGFSSIFCSYQRLKFFDYLVHKDIDFHDLNQFFKQMDQSQKGKELIETLLCYIENNGEVNTISNKLHIHRNSLTYRLQKIEGLTNKNPRNFMDLFQLFTGYVLYRMQQPSL